LPPPSERRCTAKEDVRAADDLEPEAAAGAFARGVGAGGVVGEDERRQDLALLALAGGQLPAPQIESKKSKETKSYTRRLCVMSLWVRRASL
jgi:hypothetical protein